MPWGKSRYKTNDQWPPITLATIPCALRTPRWNRFTCTAVHAPAPSPRAHLIGFHCTNTAHQPTLFYQIFSNCHNAIMSIQDRLYHHQQISGWVGIFKQCLHTPNQTKPTHNFPTIGSSIWSQAVSSPAGVCGRAGNSEELMAFSHLHVSSYS